MNYCEFVYTFGPTIPTGLMLSHCPLLATLSSSSLNTYLYFMISLSRAVWVNISTAVLFRQIHLHIFLPHWHDSSQCPFLLRKSTSLFSYEHPAYCMHLCSHFIFKGIMYQSTSVLTESSAIFIKSNNIQIV